MAKCIACGTDIGFAAQFCSECSDERHRVAAGLTKVHPDRPNERQRVGADSNVSNPSTHDSPPRIRFSHVILVVVIGLVFGMATGTAETMVNGAIVGGLGGGFLVLLFSAWDKARNLIKNWKSKARERSSAGHSPSTPNLALNNTTSTTFKRPQETRSEKYDDLIKLKTLLDEGILSQGEFDLEKARILAD